MDTLLVMISSYTKPLSHEEKKPRWFNFELKRKRKKILKFYLEKNDFVLISNRIKKESFSLFFLYVLLI